MRIQLEGFTEQEVLTYVLQGLERALAKLLADKAEIQAQIAALGGARKTKGKAAAEPTPAKEPATGKRDMSPEARERIAAAQRKRWKAARKAAAKAQPEPAVVDEAELVGAAG